VVRQACPELVEVAHHERAGTPGFGDGFVVCQQAIVIHCCQQKIKAPSPGCVGQGRGAFLVLNFEVPSLNQEDLHDSLTIPSNYLKSYVPLYQKFLSLLSYAWGNPIYPALLIWEVWGLT
jgi:hypothetical protein